MQYFKFFKQHFVVIDISSCKNMEQKYLERKDWLLMHGVVYRMRQKEV